MAGFAITGGLERRVSSALETAVVRTLGRALEFASRSMAWPRAAKRIAVATTDALLGVAAVWAAFSLRLGDFHAPDSAMLIFTFAMLGLWFPVAFMRGTYRTIFRFSGRGAIVSLMVSAAMITVPLVAGFMVVQQPDIPRTLAILGPLMFFLGLSLSRIVGRYIMVDLFSARAAGDAKKLVLIYGAGATGQRLASGLAAEAGMRVVGFLDDDESKAGHFLDGKRVHHASQVREIMQRRGVTDIVIAISEVSFTRRKAIIASLEELEVNVQTLPPMREVLEGRIGAAALRPIEVEDLLGRAVVPQHGDLLARPVTGKLVMVTGAGGSIGSEICRQIIGQKPSGLIMVDASEFALFTIGRELEAALADTSEADRPRLYQRLADVSNSEAVGRLFAEFAPHTIFHAAAYKHVSLVEENALEAVRNNVFATRAMAKAAQASGAERFVLVSTDKAVRPPNIMGASKRVCEIVLQDLARRPRAAGKRGAPAIFAPTIFTMVRFGNVLGSSGSVVPIFQRQIEAGGPVTVTHREVTRYFMTIFEAAQLVIQAGAMARGGEVFLLDMGQPVRIWDLARSMIRLAGLKVRDEEGEEGDGPEGDIAIVERGLRPGEKLYEELLLGDASAPTEHPRIMRGEETCPHPATVSAVLRNLDAAIVRGDVRACKTALKALVPTLAFEPAAEQELRPAAPPPCPSRSRPAPNARMRAGQASFN
ncbi:MAG: polysaccharide biosynthesis protein [Erythrobacter sp.]